MRLWSLRSTGIKDDFPAKRSGGASKCIFCSVSVIMVGILKLLVAVMSRN